MLRVLPEEVRGDLGDAASEIARHEPGFSLHHGPFQMATVLLWCVHEICRLRAELAARPITEEPK